MKYLIGEHKIDLDAVFILINMKNLILYYILWLAFLQELDWILISLSPTLAGQDLPINTFDNSLYLIKNTR